MQRPSNWPVCLFLFIGYSILGCGQPTPDPQIAKLNKRIENLNNEIVQEKTKLNTEKESLLQLKAKLESEQQKRQSAEEHTQYLGGLNKKASDAFGKKLKELNTARSKLTALQETLSNLKEQRKTDETHNHNLRLAAMSTLLSQPIPIDPRDEPRKAAYEALFKQKFHLVDGPVRSMQIDFYQGKPQDTWTSWLTVVNEALYPVAVQAEKGIYRLSAKPLPINELVITTKLNDGRLSLELGIDGENYFADQTFFPSAEALKSTVEEFLQGDETAHRRVASHVCRERNQPFLAALYSQPQPVSVPDQPRIELYEYLFLQEFELGEVSLRSLQLYFGNVENQTQNWLTVANNKMLYSVNVEEEKLTKVFGPVPVDQVSVLIKKEASTHYTIKLGRDRELYAEKHFFPTKESLKSVLEGFLQGDMTAHNHVAAWVRDSQLEQTRNLILQKHLLAYPAPSGPDELRTAMFEYLFRQEFGTDTDPNLAIRSLQLYYAPGQQQTWMAVYDEQLHILHLLGTEIIVLLKTPLSNVDESKVSAKVVKNSYFELNLGVKGANLRAALGFFPDKEKLEAQVKALIKSPTAN